MPERYKQILLVAGVVALVCLTRVAFIEHYAKQRGIIERNAAERQAKRELGNWLQLPYTGIDEPEFSSAFIAAIDLGNLDLSEVQRDRLQQRILTVIKYLGSPSFEDYYRMRTEGLAWKFVLDHETRRYLFGETLTNQVVFPDEPIEQARLYWEAAYRSAGTSQTNVQAVCLASLRRVLSTKNAPVDILAGEVGMRFTAANGSAESPFQYMVFGQTEEESSEKVFFQMSFYAKAKTTGTHAGPLIMSLEWRDTGQKWIPSRLFTDHMLDLNILF